MYERPCATHVRVLIHATSVCYTCPCVMYTAYTSNPRPTSSVCWSVVWTTNTSNKSKCRVHDCYKLHTSTQFLVHFFYYIRDLHILHAFFSTCASDLNKTDRLRELARDWPLHWHYNIIYIKKWMEKKQHLLKNENVFRITDKIPTRQWVG